MSRTTKQSRRRFVALAFLLAAGRAGSGGDTAVDQGETFTSPVRGEAWHAMRDPADGRKWFQTDDGRRASTLDEICLAEEADLTPLQKTVEGALLDDAQDAARAPEPVDVTLVFARQPAHDAGVAARATYAPLFATPLARSRAIFARLGARRADPDRVDAVEDEALLTAEEKKEIRAAQDLVRDLSARMRKEVCDRASAEAAADQAPVRAFLEARGDVRVFGSSWILSTVAARVPLSLVTELATRFPEIGRIERTGHGGPALSISVPTIQAGSFYSGNYTGSGATVCVLDTGVDGSHPALTLSSSYVSVSSGSQQSDFADSTSTVDDFYGHGTHVSGIVASNDATNRGVAYGATLMGVKGLYVTTSGSATYQESDIYAGGDWAATHGAQVLNFSAGQAGATTNGQASITKFFDALVFDLSVDVAICAGNSGSGSSTLWIPSDGFNVMCVGNFSDAGTTTWSDDSIAASSSRGPTSDGRRKPDIAAPGTGIQSCNASWENTSGTSDDFVAATGTSMASPHVAGAMAILRGGGASWTAEGIKALLVTTARNQSPAPTSPGNNWGYGGLDLGNAYACRNSVYESAISSSGGYQLLSVGSLSAGKRLSLVWNRHVRSNSSSAPTTYSSPTDLDLYIYNGTTGALVASSTGAVNNIEQIQVSSAVSNPVVKVVSGTFPSGVTSEPFAIAAETTSSASATVSPLSCAFTTTLPTLTYPNTDYVLGVNVTNNASFSASSPVVTLSAPSGWTIVGGGTRTLSTLTAGSSAPVSYTVRATAGPPGSKSFYVSASTTAFGGTVASAQTSTTTTLDNVPPTGSIVVAGGAAYSTAAAVTLTLSASDPTGVPLMRLRDAGGTWGAWQSYATSRSWTLPAQGSCTVEVEYQDFLGNTAGFSDGIVFDSDAPTGSVSLGVGQFTNAATADLVVSATDAVLGVSEQRIGDGSSVGAWEPYGTAHVVSLGASGTLTTRTAQYRDPAGNTSPTYSVSTTRDSVAPTGSIVVNNGAAYTNDAHVVLALASSDDASGVGEMRLSFDGGATWSPWAGASTSVGCLLPVADALNTVQVQYRDRAGNTSVVYSASIFVDATGPTGTLAIDGGAPYTSASTVTLTLSASDASSGVAAMRLRDEVGVFGAWTPFAASVQWPLPAGEGAKTVLAQFRDGSGNDSSEIAATIVRDVSPPRGTLAILGGPAVNHADVEFALTSSDEASGVVEMRLMNDGGAWGAWTPVGESADFALTPGEGVRRAWAQWKDAVGNVSGPVSAEILVDLTAPTGALALDGGSPLLLPWDALVAEPTADDGAAGSGVATVEYSRDGGATWSDAFDPSLATPLAAPELVEGAFTVLARWRDVAGNLSAAAAASAYRVAPASQRLDAAKSLTGVLAAGGDVDSYTVELLAGDLLSVKQTVRPTTKGAKFDVALDVYDPTNARVVDGRFPVGAKRSGIAKYFATKSGTYVVVVRALGTAAAEGGAYSLAASVKPGKRPKALKGFAAIIVGTTPPTSFVAFDAADGASVSGTAKLLVNTPYELIGPDGSTVFGLLKPVRGVAKLARLPLTGGTGKYELHFFDKTTYALKLSPAPRAARAVETPGAGER